MNDQLTQKWQDALAAARALRERDGDPIDGLEAMIGDVDLWIEVIESEER